jgi:hypothetical protein
MSQPAHGRAGRDEFRMRKADGRTRRGGLVRRGKLYANLRGYL